MLAHHSPSARLSSGNWQASSVSYSRYHLLDTSLDDVLGDFFEHRGIGLINASPLNMGLLTEKGPPDWHPAPERVKAAVGELVAFCQSRGVNLSQLAMQFALFS